LPNSASAFVSNTVAQILDVPVFRVSVGGIVSGWVVRKRAAQIIRGPATTHEHDPALAANIDALVQAGVRKVSVQIRDPRAAWWSFFRHVDRRPDLAKDSAGPEECYSRANTWLQGWIDASRAPGSLLEVVFVQYEDVRLRLKDTIARVFDEVGYDVPVSEIAHYIDSTTRSARRPENFRVGDPDDWRRGVSPELADRFWQLTPESVRDLLSMAA
jgi:hypothetical protein